MKIGRIAPCDHVVCLTHTLHLVVSDVLYPKPTTASTVDVADDEEDSDIDSDDDVVDDGSQEGDERLPEPSINGVPTPLFDNIEPTLRQVRITVNKFRRSPVKNDNLQVDIERHCGKKLSLTRDCKTRWSALHAMLERFLKLSEPINKMLEEYNLTSLKLETHQLQTVKDIVVALEPFKVATTYLCDRKKPRK